MSTGGEAKEANCERNGEKKEKEYGKDGKHIKHFDTLQNFMHPLQRHKP